MGFTYTMLTAPVPCMTKEKMLHWSGGRVDILGHNSVVCVLGGRNVPVCHQFLHGCSLNQSFFFSFFALLKFLIILSHAFLQHSSFNS